MVACLLRDGAVMVEATATIIEAVTCAHCRRVVATVGTDGSLILEIRHDKEVHNTRISLKQLVRLLDKDLKE